MDEVQAVAELRQILETTVRSQLVADVPVGLFLSGGIDSSTIAAFAAASASQPVKSFSVGFSRPDFDESPLARTVAAHLGTEHHEVRMEDMGFDSELLDLIIDHVGQPMGDTSCIPTYAVSRLARDHVKVVLSGDGGDEFFGGYDHMFWVARVHRAAQWPIPARRLATATLRKTRDWAPSFSTERIRRWTKGLELTLHPATESLRRLMALWPPEEVAGLLARGLATPEPYPHPPLPTGAQHLELEEQAMMELARTYMPGAILTKVDRMSMAASLEVRPPLLDRRVVDFASRLPLALKIRNGVGKHLLREAGRPYLPQEVYQHRKQGFAIPLKDWLNDRFWEQLQDTYSPGSKASRLFHRERLDQTIREARAGTIEQRVSNQAAASRVWQLAMIGRWMERFQVST